MTVDDTPGGSLWPLMLPATQWDRDSLCTVSASGVRVRFADGRELLDGSSGLWNVNLGYGNEAIASAASAALRDASYLSVWSYENSYAREAAHALRELAGRQRFARVIFSCSGGAANDLTMKLVRQYHALVGEPDRRVILGLRDGYHGLTYGAFALTDAQLGHRLYGVDRRLVGHVTANDSAGLDAALDHLNGRLAAIVVEPVLGTAAQPLTDDYIRRLLERRQQSGYLLVVDEVSTGFGRIGNAVFESSRWPEAPDILITAKGLTNGTMPASAVLVSTQIAAAFGSRRSVLAHAETQAGTPVVCAAMLATISELSRLDAVAASARLSNRLDRALDDLTDQLPIVRGSSGRGCLRAILLGDLDGRPLDPAQVPEVVAAIRRAGALVHPGPSCVQLLPALIYSDDDFDELLGRVRAGLATVNVD